MKFLASISSALYNVGLFAWDISLTLGNLVRFNRPVGEVTPEGQPGYGGYWPEYKPPQKGDSRSCCPALNAMANHGIIPRNGKGLKFTKVAEHIRATYNFSPSFCSFVGHYAASMLNKDYNKDMFNLEELNLHNGIEHDASLTRVDTALQPNQAVICSSDIEEMFSFATGKDSAGNPLLTLRDLARFSGKRRAECRARNKEFSLQLIHKIFGSTNTSTLLDVFGGRIDDLRVVLLEERLPQGWESRFRKPYGLTIFTFNLTIFPLEFCTRESDWTGAANRAVEESA